MLQIFEKGKATSLLQHTRGRVPTEDILTGAVFGIINYVDCALSLAMLKALLADEFNFPHSVTKVELTLWPKISVRETWIEPDVLIDLYSAAKRHSARIIIESKWNAPFGENQAIKQWRHSIQLSGGNNAALFLRARYS